MLHLHDFHPSRRGDRIGKPIGIVDTKRALIPFSFFTIQSRFIVFFIKGKRSKVINNIQPYGEYPLKKPVILLDNDLIIAKVEALNYPCSLVVLR